MKKISFSSPDIVDSDIQLVEDVIRSGWLTHGKYSTEFEKVFADFTGSKYAITVSNCTAGLHLSCMALGIKDGDEVIVPAQTHTATSHAVELTGARAIFADVDNITGNIDILDIKNKITGKTKGIIPVHMAGFPCKMDEIMDLCKENNLFLIEDCAHGFGTKYSGKHVGNFGVTGNFSFYPTKQITTGEGGMVVTNEKKIYEFIKAHKAFGINVPPEYRVKPGLYDVEGLGLNYRMTDFQAALGIGQVKRYDYNLEKRKINAKLYEKHLSSNEKISFAKFDNNCSYFLFQIILHPSLVRDEMVNYLKKLGIGLSIHYATPVPLMSYYRDKYNYSASDFPSAVNYAKQSISLPVHMNLGESDISFICDKINIFCENK